MVSETPGSSSMVIQSKPTAIGPVCGRILSKLEANNFGGEDIFTARALKVDAVDPIGAGDALTGAYAGSLALGFPPLKALSIGCIAGALAASKPGPQSSGHTLQDVLELYNTHYL